jgi:hypothetical protein
MLQVDRRFDVPSRLECWYAKEPPAYASEEWFTAEADKHQWVVSLGSTGPKARLREQDESDSATVPFEIKPGPAKDGLAGRRIAARVDDGWIIGFNHGEFGSGLWWFSPDGERRYKISNIQLVSLFPNGKELLAVEGIAHGGVSTGEIVRLFRGRTGRWEGKPLVDLGAAPKVAIKDVDGSIIVATTNRLLRVVPASKRIHVIVDNVFWGGLYPNSMVTTASGSIFIGMRHGVAKIERAASTYRVRWLLPSKDSPGKERDHRFR